MESEYPDGIYSRVRNLYESIMEGTEFMPRNAVASATVDPLVSGGSHNTPIPNSNDADDSRGDYPNPAVPGTYTKENPKCVSERPAWVNTTFGCPAGDTSKLVTALRERTAGVIPNKNLANRRNFGDASVKIDQLIDNAEAKIPTKSKVCVEPSKTGMEPMRGIGVHAGFGNHISSDVGYQSSGGGAGGQ